MNSLFNKHRWMQVVWGILLFVAGSITIIFAATNEEADVKMALSIAVAVVLFAYGLTICFSSFLELKDKFFKYEIIIGAFVIAVGIVFCLNIDLISGILVDVISASLLTFGAAFAARAILSFATRLRVWWNGLCIFFAITFITCGVLCIVFQQYLVNACYIVLGGILIVVGIIEVYMSVKRALEANRDAIEQKDFDPANNKKEKANKKKDAKKDDVVVDATNPEVFDNEEVVDVDVTAKNELIER